MGVSIFEGNKARRMTSALEVISQNIENLIAPDVAQETAVIAESKKWTDGKDLAGNPVPSTAPQYENNAKYYAEQTEAAKTTAVQAIEAKGEQILHSIPSDYTELSGEVVGLNSAVTAVTKVDKESIAIPENVNIGKYVDYKSGSLSSFDTYNATDYIDISRFSELLYKRCGTTSSTTLGGMAFYSASYGYVTGAQNAINQSANGYLSNYNRIYVPANAKYVRFSFFANSTTYGNFELYGINKSVYISSEVNQMCDDSLIDISSGIEWSQGNLYSTTGGEVSANNRIRTDNITDGFSGFYVADGYKATVFVYRLTDFVSCWNGYEIASTSSNGLYNSFTTFSGLVLFNFPDGYKYRFVLSRLDNANISPQEGLNLKVYAKANSWKGAFSWTERVNGLRRLADAQGLYFIPFNALGLSISRGNGLHGNDYVADQIHPTALGGYNLAMGVWSYLKNIPCWYTSIPEDPVQPIDGTQWNGKTWYAYGTSLTTEANGHWANYVANMSGMNLVNKGIAGGALVTNRNIYNALVSTTDGKLNADLITIEIGANDLDAMGKPWSKSTYDFFGTLNTAIKAMFDAGIQAQVVIMASFGSRYNYQDSSEKYDVDRLIN